MIWLFLIFATVILVGAFVGAIRRGYRQGVLDTAANPWSREVQAILEKYDNDRS